MGSITISPTGTGNYTIPGQPDNEGFLKFSTGSNLTWESANTSAISSGTSRVLVDGGIQNLEMKLNNNFGAAVDTIGLSYVKIIKE